MKKSLLTLILCATVMGIGYAQFTDGMVLQPTNVVAKRYNASGQLIKEMTSTYGYDGDGKLTNYSFPDHSLWSTYSYTDNLLMREYTYHGGGHPLYGESFEYTYENYKVKTKAHLWGAMNSDEHWLYSYDAEGRLERMDYRSGYEAEYHMHYLYEYEDEGRTKTENYWTSWVTQGMKLRKKTVFQYDEAFNLLTKHIENYNTEGELTKTTLTTYTYTPSGKEESIVTQTLTDGEWVNTSIIRFVLDDNDRVTERQVGSWSAEINDWKFTSKTVYELNEEESTLTVSFYKKSGEEWVWDEYVIQPIFYEPYLEKPEEALRFYEYDDMFGEEHISQFVFTLAETNEPTYVNTEEHQSLNYSIYPNPSKGELTVVAPTEDAVIRLYNLQGQRVMARPFDFSTEINAEALPSGMYLWEIWHNNQKEACGKWVKE